MKFWDMLKNHFFWKMFLGSLSKTWYGINKSSYMLKSYDITKKRSINVACLFQTIHPCWRLHIWAFLTWALSVWLRNNIKALNIGKKHFVQESGECLWGGTTQKIKHSWTIWHPGIAQYTTIPLRPLDGQTWDESVMRVIRIYPL